MQHYRTNEDPEQLSCHTMAEAVAYDSQAVALDAARAEFRAGWQAKLDRKRLQAERARQLQLRSWNIRNYLYRVTLAMFCVVWLVGAIGVLASLPGTCLVIGALGGGALGFGSSCSEWFWRKHAERLVRAVRELERT